MKIFLTLGCWLVFMITGFGQTKEIDSLKEIINQRKGDRASGAAAFVRLVNSMQEYDGLDSFDEYSRKGVYYLPKDLDSVSNVDSVYMNVNTVDMLSILGMYYQFQFRQLDSAILLNRTALDLSQRLNYRKGEAISSMDLGEHYRLKGDFSQALELLYGALKISREIQDTVTEATSLGFIGLAYAQLGEYKKGLDYMFQAVHFFPHLNNSSFIYFTFSNIGYAYERFNMLDSGQYFQEKALHLVDSAKMNFSPLESQIFFSMGLIYARLGHPNEAIRYYHDAIRIHDHLNLGISQYLLAELFYTLHQPDSSLYYARLGFENTQISGQSKWILDASRLLVRIYADRKMIDSAFHYQSIAVALRDSFYGPQEFDKLQLLAVSEQQERNDIVSKQMKAEREKENLANKIRTYGLLAVLAVFLLIALILFRNNRQKQQANTLLSQQKTEIAETLTQLKSTQAQLIQSEKMASLGELTAGIAHEIQNPLNFINNFSEVNAELIGELEEETNKGNLNEVKLIAKDIKENEQKIVHHGRRADSIVKGMLQHSRSGTGKKEPADINSLADEYLKLAYHGLRARDKEFNATLKTDFDQSLGQINIMPQDIGRALLNLYNNAFYVVAEKKKLQPAGYEPTVSVSTRRSGNKVEIRVKDNGNGIPPKVLDKIFHPFFTTKPPGQGTGLGLSLSYDIVKAHGGEIKVDTKEGGFTEFIITLPA